MHQRIPVDKEEGSLAQLVRLTWKAFIMEFSNKNRQAAAISSGVVNRRGNMLYPSTASLKYWIRSPDCIRGEMTRAGASELTRIPQGARKSAAASVIPRTQAVESRIERQSGRNISQLLPPFHLPPHPFIQRKDIKLTLRRPISQTPSRRRMPNNARQINDTSSFFDYPFVKDVQRWVLRVDSVGGEGVDEEGAVGVHFEDCFEVLQIGIDIQYAKGGMNEGC